MPVRTKRAAPFDTDIDLFKEFSTALQPTDSLPWENITDFATHPDFCGLRMYPRQLTLLRLIYLETENMTAYDVDVIEKWREGWRDPTEPCGVQEDVWERIDYLKARGYRHFPHIESLVGRRGSKGMIGGILGAEKMAQFYALDNWQEHYGIAPGKDGFIQVVATSLTQSKKFQFADIRSAVESCKYLERAIVISSAGELALRTPADARRLAYMRSRKMPIDHTIASLRAVALSANSASGRGGTAFMNAFDEFAHAVSGTGSAKDSGEIYEAFQPSLDQFGKDSLTYIPTSPFMKTGKAFALYNEGRVLMGTYDEETGRTTYKMRTAEEIGADRDEEGEKLVELTANPEMLVVQLPSWGLYEDWEHSERLGGPKIKRPIQVYDERMKRLERANPDKFAVERRAQFASVLNAYLNPRKVEAMFDPWNGLELCPQDRGRLDIEYYVHVDPSKTNANFAVTVAHMVEAPPDQFGQVWPHVVVDFMHVWKPEDFEDHTVDYVEIGQYLDELLGRFPSTVSFTFDQWNSAGFIAALRKKYSPGVRIAEETFTNQSNDRRMERFKTALNLQWVHAYLDDFYDEDEGGSLLEMELKFLERRSNGKVDKQSFGPVTTKDLADTVMVVTDKLLGEHLDRWQAQQLGTSVLASGSSDVAGLRSGRELERQEAFRGSASDVLGSGWKRETARDRIDQLSNNSRGTLEDSYSSLRRATR